MHYCFYLGRPLVEYKFILFSSSYWYHFLRDAFSYGRISDGLIQSSCHKFHIWKVFVAHEFVKCVFLDCYPMKTLIYICYIQFFSLHERIDVLWGSDLVKIVLDRYYRGTLFKSAWTNLSFLVNPLNPPVFENVASHFQQRNDLFPSWTAAMWFFR